MVKEKTDVVRDEVAAEKVPVLEALEKRKTLVRILSEEKYLKWVLLIPILVVLGAFAFYPLFYCVYGSFNLFPLGRIPKFIGLQNYKELLHNLLFWADFGRTIYLTVVCIVVEGVLGMLIALLLNREFKGQNVIRGLCLMPVVASPLAMSLVWNYILHYEYGIVNAIMALIGLPRVAWLATPRTALYGIILFDIWQWTPFAIFVFLAALRGLPKDAFEAAQVDGASRWFTFRKLTLPMLRPIITIVVLLRSIWLINTFDALYGTTRGGLGTETVNYMIYRVAFIFFDVGRGSTLALLTMYITIIIAVILYRQLISALEKTR